MQYFPEKMILKKESEDVVVIKSDSEPVARINLKHSVWRLSSEEKSDQQYMQAIELLGNTKKLEGISAHYQIGGTVIPVFKSRETKDGTKIFYDTSCNSDSSVPFREIKRECGDVVITPHFLNYEHMQGLNITKYDGYEVFNKKSHKTTRYDKTGVIIPEQKDREEAKKNISSPNKSLFKQIAQKIFNKRSTINY